MHFFFFQGKGLTAFILFKKEYVISERLRTTAFNTYLHSFSFQVRIHRSYRSLTEINPKNRQRNLSEAYSKSSQQAKKFAWVSFL